MSSGNGPVAGNLPEKYTPRPVPSDIEILADWLQDELDRIAIHMRERDVVVCGKETLSSGTATVTFAREQPDTEYYILMNGNVSGEIYHRANKAVTGFDIVESTATSTAVVHWAIFRDRDND